MLAGLLVPIDATTPVPVVAEACAAIPDALGGVLPGDTVTRCTPGGVWASAHLAEERHTAPDTLRLSLAVTRRGLDGRSCQTAACGDALLGTSLSGVEEDAPVAAGVSRSGVTVHPGGKTGTDTHTRAAVLARRVERRGIW